MIIGVDIDDTIALTNDRIIKEAFEYDRKYLRGRGFKNKNAYTFMDMFYWSVLDVDSFFKYIHGIRSDYYLEIDPKDNASIYINKLIEEGNKIYLITRRSDTLKVRNKTKRWLKKYGFKYNKLVMGVSEKGRVCNELNVDVFIDNDVNNVTDASKYGIECILMADNYNKDEKEFTKFSEWEDVYNYIKEVK